MSREMKDSGIEWIGSLPSTWKICKVKNCFVRKNDKAMQEDPVILSLARSGVKIRDISKNEGQIAESYSCCAVLRCEGTHSLERRSH